MKRFSFLSYILMCIFIAFICGSVSAQDNFPASKDPPNGLATERVPQFVNIGFDDNGYVDGMEWILNYFRDLKNQAGLNNPSTYDGTPARVIFYFSTYYGAEDETLKNLWKSAYKDGHEIANHTVNHNEAMAGWTQEQWETELDSANTWMIQNIDIPKEEIYGFRTPFLAFSYFGNTHFAVKGVGLIYDCSLNAGSEIIGDGSDFYWPYTMDEGSPDEHYIVAVPGLWQVPVHYVMVSGGGRMTGFDYNLWSMLKQSKSSFVATLKKTLDLRYNGNRAPLCFGGHTDYYSEHNETANQECSGASWQERRKAVEEFIDYAISLPDVRIVPSIDIIRWLRNPVALDDITEKSAEKTVCKSGLSIKVFSDGNVRMFIPSEGVYTIQLHNVSGRKIGPSFQGFYKKGSYSFNLDLNTEAQSIYYVSIQGNTNRIVKKAILLK